MPFRFFHDGPVAVFPIPPSKPQGIFVGKYFQFFLFFTPSPRTTAVWNSEFRMMFFTEQAV
jgi:hypothetical protein